MIEKIKFQQSIKFKLALFFKSLIFISTFGMGKSFAATINYPNLNVKQGFVFNGTDHSMFGHVISLKLGSISFSQDIATLDPVRNYKTSVVGVMQSIVWSQINTEPIYLKMYVSPANVQRFESYFRSPTAKAEIEIDFQLYAYDPTGKQFFITLKSFALPPDYKGILGRIGHNKPEMQNRSYPLFADLKYKGALTYKIDKTPVKFDQGKQGTMLQLTLYPAPKRTQSLISTSGPNHNTKLYWGEAVN